MGGGRGGCVGRWGGERRGEGVGEPEGITGVSEITTSSETQGANEASKAVRKKRLPSASSGWLKRSCDGGGWSSVRGGGDGDRRGEGAGREAAARQALMP